MSMVSTGLTMQQSSGAAAYPAYSSAYNMRCGGSRVLLVNYLSITNAATDLIKQDVADQILLDGMRLNSGSQI